MEKRTNMRKVENIHVGSVSEYNLNKAIIYVAGKDYQVIPSQKESDFLEDMIYNVKLNYIAFDIANKRAIIYKDFQQAYDKATFENKYIAFINMFKG